MEKQKWECQEKNHRFVEDGFARQIPTEKNLLITNWKKNKNKKRISYPGHLIFTHLPGLKISSLFLKGDRIPWAYKTWGSFSGAILFKPWLHVLSLVLWYESILREGRWMNVSHSWNFRTYLHLARGAELRRKWHKRMSHTPGLAIHLSL